MKISDIYIGCWFQRTMLQLSEIYDFLRDCNTHISLDRKKLEQYRNDLDLKNIIYSVSGEEYIKAITNSGITIKIFEDGLITLNDADVKIDSLSDDIDQLTKYYETKLSPAISYLFSLGAPIPKELADIKTVYPYFVVFEDTTKEDMENFLFKIENIKYFEFSNNKYDVVRGDKYYLINNKKQSMNKIERYIEEQIFIREFKGQLHRYLNIHRIIWERIDNVKKNTNIRGSEIVKFTTKLEKYAKTVNLIEARINQMGTYLNTREKIAKSDEELKEFLKISGYRYETLDNTLEYIKHLWTMTKNYVESAQKLFNNLKKDITNKSLNNLTIITTMTAYASIIRLFTSEAPVLSLYNIIYFTTLVLLGWASTKVIRYVSNKKTYKLIDDNYEKHIK